MDVEARRKFCGLLMFDIPTISMKSPTSRNNDIIINNMSTQEVDPSSLNNNHSLSFESSHNPIDHQFIIQDNFTSDFATTTRALAAGAAATSDDLLNQDASNAMDGDNSRSQPQKRTPRPPNAFILYRRAKQPGIIASQRNLTNAEVSRTISDMWRKEPEETRLEWEKYADRKKLEHMQTYPNYVYRPNKNKSKVDKRRQNRRQTTNSSNGSSNNNNSNSVENKAINSGVTTVRRKSTKNSNRPLSKLDLPLSMNNNGMAGFNMQPSSISMNQQQSSTNSTSHSDSMTSNSSYTILPSPEIPLMSSHFTENPEEFVTSQSQLTPLTPLTPHTPLTPISTPEIQMREHDFKIRQQYQNSLLRFEDLNAFQQQQHHNHHHQGNAQFSFQSMNGLTPYNPTGFSQVDQLEYFVPDVAQQQQQMMAEMLLHHEQHHHITPATTTVPSSNSTSISTIPVQYYSGSNATNAAIAGNPSFTEMLNNLEFQTFLSGSVNHAPDQYLQ